MLIHSLTDQNYEIDSVMASNADLCKLAAHHQLDILVVALKCTTRQSMKCMQQLLQRHPIPVVMFVTSGDVKSAVEATQAGVSAYVVNGLSPERIRPILATAVTRFQQTHNLRQQLDKAQLRLEERKLIERAKGMLMKQHGCGEEDAYAAMRNLAMEQNKRLSEIAEGVIKIASLIN